MRAIYRIVCFGAALIAASCGAMSASAQSVDESTPPPPPEWVGPDGRLDLEKAPEEFLLAGPDGRISRDASGIDMKVPSSLATLPPPPIRPNYDDVSVAKGSDPRLRMLLRRAADEQLKARGDWMEIDEVDGVEYCYGVIGGVAFAESPCGAAAQ